MLSTNKDFNITSTVYFLFILCEYVYEFNCKFEILPKDTQADSPGG